nr:hypothetical protein [uncultured Dysosmobacter sp.]
MAKKDRPQENTGEAWERMAGESVQQYEKFCAYRDMRYTQPPADKRKDDDIPRLDITRERSIRGLARKLKMSRKALEPLSARFHWVERCEAYDLYILQRIRTKAEAEVLKMHETHAAIAAQMLKKALGRLLTLPDGEISAADLVRMVDIGVKVENLSRGESTERREIGGEVTTHTKETLDLSSLSDDDLRRLAQLGGTGGDGDGKDV